MKQRLTILTLLLSLTLLSGCAGGLIVLAGTAVAVNSDERSIATQIADDNLSLTALDKVNELAINPALLRINFISNDGYLLVIGQVSDETQKARIEAQLNTLTDAKAVYNQLRIGKPIGFSQQSKDSWITTKAKSQLTAHDSVNPLKIKVVTENGELFLIGLVDNKTADAATNVARKISGVTHVRRVFQIIPEE